MINKDLIEIVEVVAKRFTDVESEIESLKSLLDKLQTQNKELARRVGKLEDTPANVNHYHYDRQPNYFYPTAPYYPNINPITCGGVTNV